LEAAFLAAKIRQRQDTGAGIDMSDALFEIGGKVALVTGGTSGIGLMIARGLVRRGVRTYITGRAADRAAEAARQLSAYGPCRGLQADRSDAEGPKRLAETFRRNETRLGILINNAGIGDMSGIEDVCVADWDEVMNVNLRAAFFLVQELLPELRAAATVSDPGRIINIGSIGGLHIPGWDAFPYGASKAGLHYLTRALAKRLGRDHITANAIAPGPFPSRLTDVESEAVKRTVAAHIPAGRPGTAEDVEGVVVFLASRAGAYVNGATVPLDGGYIACL
jgi:NAD(P)-dependent dehydrogenase (short-subunit alcohol dehydrogenase family)